MLSEIVRSVANDYPKEIDDIRKAVYPVYKNARKKNLKATLHVDRLIRYKATSTVVRKVSLVR